MLHAHLNKILWRHVLEEAYRLEEMKRVHERLTSDVESGKDIQPIGDTIYMAYRLTQFDSVKIVILGQDPYPTKGNATGLAFATPMMGYRGGPVHKSAASLNNILKEVYNNYPGQLDEKNINLYDWARQGVLLLNTVLTVEVGKPNSHKGIGWEAFTDKTIELLNEKHEHLVFMLWGKHAQEKIKLIDENKHLILTAAHPSPFSAHHGFFGCNHFVKANQYLVEHGIDPIIWLKFKHEPIWA